MNAGTDTTNLPRLLYSKQEAAEILAVDVSAIDGLLRNDATPRHIIRGKLRFSMADLETIMEQAQVTE